VSGLALDIPHVPGAPGYPDLVPAGVPEGRSAFGSPPLKAGRPSMSAPHRVAPRRHQPPSPAAAWAMPT